MTAPPEIHDVARPHLVGLSAERQQSFALRVDRWWEDLWAGVAELYPDPGPVTRDLVERAAAAYADRDPDLHRLDERRLLQPDWLQQPGMFGYACYTERFADDLKGITTRLDHLQDLGVTYLHLMPLLQPREGDNDGGYAVQDYRSVRPDLGTMDDLRDLASTLRGEGISLVMDLVLNHVAREHEWAERARGGDAAYRDYFRIFPDRTGPDAYDATVPEVFPDFAPGNFTWDDEVEGWVWTTFNSWQWDLNWANPAVLEEFAGIVLDLANTGVEVLRLDAIAFMWKRLGTSCQNQDEVHAITQTLRTVARLAAPAVAFKAEAIVGPRDLVQYLGVNEHAGRASDLAYHNSLMVQIWSMLATGDTALARQALGALPPKPTTGTWITYVRCHDDIGWAIDDADAWAVGVTGPGHRRFLADWYTGEFPGAWGNGVVFQFNPATGDKRVSGTAASLVGMESDEDRGTALLFLAHADRGRLGRGPGDLERRRARPAQRPGLGERARARRRQPLGRTTPARRRGGRAAARPGHRRRPGVRGARAPGPGTGHAAAAARLRRERRAGGHRPRGLRRRPPARQRRDGRSLQRHRGAAALPDAPVARGRVDLAVRRDRWLRGHRGSRRADPAPAVRRLVGGRRTAIGARLRGSATVSG